MRSTTTALAVETLLALITHGRQLLSGPVAPTWVMPMLPTDLVPFAVATSGQVQGKRKRDRPRRRAASPASPHAEAAAVARTGVHEKER